MKKGLLLIFIGLFSMIGYAQINSNSPAVPFNSRTSYSNGIMPNNLPSGGTYGKSQDAATAYNAWKSLVVSCTSGGSRVLFDDGSATVSEGIGYGMLLAAYAGDKTTFDVLWQYYKAHEDGNGLMNWKYSDCSTMAGSSGATDADEDAAMALVIAAEQWPSATSPYTYKTEATTLIHTIKSKEIASSGQPVCGDGWGTSSTERNPSYMAPAYYTEFAIFDATNATFWNNCASAASTLLIGNRNTTTGLVSNWCSNTSPFADDNWNNDPGYGYDACRNPWRMAVDVLWHGSSAVAASTDICSKLSIWLKGYEANLKGPFTNQTAANPSMGTYKNGSFSPFGLAPMGTSSTNQTSLNSCYTNVVGLGNSEVYFSRTLRCLSLFVMTGNFWKPGSSNSAPIVTSATTNATGTTITVNFSTAITYSAADYSKFTLKIGGTAVSGAITAIAAIGTTAVDLTIASGKIVAGSVVTLDYTPGTIKNTSTTPLSLAAFSAQSVTNAIPVGNTIIADCEDANMTKLLTAWYSYADKTTTISPVTSATVPFQMTLGGANNTDSAAIVTGYLAKPASPDFESAGIGFTFKDPEADYDLTGATGISFWHKGDAVNFSVMLSTVTANKGYDYSYSVPSHTNWTLVEVKFTDANFGQPSWMSSSVPTELKTWDPSKITKIQWQVKDGSARNYTFGIDEVAVMGKILSLPGTTTVSKTALTTAISTANTIYTAAVEGTATGNYPAGSKTTLMSAITAATAVNTNASATQAQVDAAVATLNTAVTTFQNSVIGVSKTALATAISTANTIYTVAVEGPATGNYPTGSKTTLMSTITVATIVNTNASATQAQVDAAVTTLNAAVTAFQSKVITIATGTLIFNAETTNLTLLNTPWFSYNDNDATPNKGASTVTPLSTSTDAFTMTSGGANGTANAAKIAYTLDAGALTYEPFVGMGFAMKDPAGAYDLTGSTGITFYYKSENPLVLEINLTTISDDCNFYVNLPAATTWTKKTLIWSQFAQYSTWGIKVTWDLTKINKFQWKIQSASGTTGSIWVDEVQIDGVNLTLPGTTTVSKTALATAISTANTIYTAAVEGTANGNYPAGSKTTLMSAITVATTVNTNASASQADVDAAVATLNAAVTTFQNSVIGVNKTALVTAISNAKNIHDLAVEGSAYGQYPAPAKATLQSAITVATAVNANASASQADVDAAVATLNVAVTAFNQAKVTTAIAEISQKSVIAYPNPCADVLHIESSKSIARISIINIFGIEQQSMQAIGSEMELSVSSLAKGVYFIKFVTVDGTIQTVKIIKE